MKRMKAILCILMTIVAIQLLGDNLIDVVNEAELFIKRAYEGEIARHYGLDKLQKIILDPKMTEKEKMDAIRLEFFAPKKVDEDKITDANAYRLIWTPPLSWYIHSIAIAYDVEQSQSLVISAETVEAKKTSRATSTENGEKSSIGKSASGVASAGGGMSWSKLIPNLDFVAEAKASRKSNWDESKTELWSKSHQEQLTSNFEELTKDIRSTQVSKCHLTFAIDFQNNGDEDLMFSASSTVPVYMGTTLVLNAMPENIGNSQVFTIPSKATIPITFRGEIRTTQAYRLLEFMKNNSPTISPEKGLLAIYSLNGKIKKAIQESLSVRHSVIRCGEYEWKVRNTWNNRRVTLREALWAVNSLYEKGPFDIENDVCTTMFGQFRCGPYPGMAEAEAYPIVEMDGRFFSRLGKEQLDGRIPENGVRFYMGSVKSYLDSDDYAPKFYELLLNDLLFMAEQDRNGKIKNYLGSMYFDGKGTSKNMPKAVEWWHKSAEKENAEAQRNLGISYECGEGVLKDMVKAVEWYRRAAEQGNVEAQCNLSDCYALGRGVEMDKKKAMEWCRKAADQGHAKAQFAMGWYYYNGVVVEKDMSKAVEWWRKSAEQGNAKAQVSLGLRYTNGEGVSKDMVEAAKWYRKAAEQEDVDAQELLGLFYSEGMGVRKNMAEAVKWYRKAAEQGRDEAQNMLGVFYERGEGVETDMGKAFEWYRKAAEQGSDIAQFNLYRCYHKGLGVRKDTTVAYKWCRKSAEQGNDMAQASLGLKYEIGEEVEQNMTEAIKWYRKAAEQGNDFAMKRLQELKQ